jgi:DNA-directed RNA polymerase specialized sigma24 family protein
MLTIAVNVWRDHVRRALRKGRLFVEGQELDAREGRERAPQDQDYDRAEWGRIVRPPDLRQAGSCRAPERLWEVFDLAFRGLREEERKLLSSFYRNDRRTLPVAIECDLPCQRVKVRVFRARRRLIGGMERRLGCSLAASGAPSPAPRAESVARLEESAA